MMDDEVLEKVSGGRSLHEEADGTARDSWLASLVSKLITNEEKPKPDAQDNNAVPLTAFVAGDTGSKQ